MQVAEARDEEAVKAFWQTERRERLGCGRVSLTCGRHHRVHHTRAANVGRKRGREPQEDDVGLFRRLLCAGGAGHRDDADGENCQQ